MKFTSFSRLPALACAATAALLLAAGASAAPKSGAPLLGDRAITATADLPATAKRQSGVTGTLNPGALNAPALNLVLADGTALEARLDRTANDGKGVQSWIGSFADAPGSVLVLTRAKGVVTGFANYKDTVLEIVPTGTGKHVLYAVDSGKLPGRFEGLVRPQKQGGDTLSAAGAGYGTGASALTAADAVVQDILVLYTAATATRLGGAAIAESQIRSAVQSTNQAYLNSQVNITLNPVAVQQTALVEQSNSDAMLTLLENDATTLRLRDQLAADIVVLVSENSDYCGYSNIMTSNDAGFAPSAFGVVNSGCLSNQSLAHEVGHQQGLMHDRANSGWAGAYPYSYGYRVCATDGTGWRDVMSYPCSTGSGPRVLQFSNPNVTYNGYATGVSYELNPAGSAEAARSLNNTATTVAAFRGATPTPTPTPTPTTPAAPSGMTVQKATYNAVTVGWTDVSSDETGFKVERSKDGVTYAEIATVGSNSVSYTDGTVTAKTTYYYRVRAYNSAGVSAYSGAASVTTPDVPIAAPPAPTGMTTADNKDGTALVSWTVGSTTNASGFEVRRETYNAKNGSWGGAVTAATVPASVFSIVDSSGAGTFRYSVRATDSGGASVYVGPVQVTVTAPVTTTVRKGKRR